MYIRIIIYYNYSVVILSLNGPMREGGVRLGTQNPRSNFLEFLETFFENASVKKNDENENDGLPERRMENGSSRT